MLEASGQETAGAGIVVAPMGVGELLDAGFNLTRRYYGRLFMVGAWGQIPGGVASAISGALSVQGMTDASLVGAVIALFLLSTVASALAYAAVVLGFARIIEPTGDPRDLETLTLYRAALGRFWAMLGWWLIIVVLAVPLVILFPLGVFLLVRWLVSSEVILIERRGPVASLQRSWALTRGAWWHTLAVVLVSSMILGIIAIVVAGLLGGIAGAAGFLLGDMPLAQALGNVAGTAASLVITPPSVAYYVILYYELRARTEGYDLTQRARQTATPAP